MKLEDYKGREAMELWGKLIKPIGAILKDKEVINGLKAEGAIIDRIQPILTHIDELTEIFEIIDGRPVNGLTLPMRVVELLTSISNMPEFSSFFGNAEQ